MSQEAVERLLGRLITDERFRTQAAVSLEKASLQKGYRLSQAELLLLSGLALPYVTRFAGHLNPGLCRAGGAHDETKNAYGATELKYLGN